ncbi:hypothetical protein G6F42_019856 [Rhizopus arrhizus]|nr:hypothetical protein G6F42_019856 [Rhizopus arrhizus]
MISQFELFKLIVNYINSNVKKADTVAVSWTPLLAIVEKYDIRRQSRAPAKSIRTQDIFTFYTDQTGEISPLVSSDEEEEDSENDQDIDEKQEESAADKSSSSSLSSSSSMAATTPPAPPPKESLIIPQLPLQPPPKDQHRPLVVSGTKSLPVRNHSLRQSPPIPSNMLSPDVTARAPDTPMPVRPPNVRSVSAQPPQPIIESSSTTPSATSSTSSSSSSSVSNGNTKKPSFMRSVMAAVSNRSSLRHSKSNLKPSIDSVLSSSTPNLKSPPSKNAMQNMSTVSLDQQTLKRPTDPALMRRYSAANLSTDQHQQQQQQPPLPPQHLTIPSHQQQQSPFGQRSSFINNHSTPSFASSQSSLALTPPLSRSSSPGSMTPVGLSRYQTPSSSSSEDLGSPPESPDILLQHGNTIKSVLYSNQQSQVFHWKDESWYAVQEDCSVEVRQTYSNRSCVAIHMKKTGQLYLNAWVLPDTFICRTTETDLSLSLHITSSQSELENYLIHCESKLEADHEYGHLRYQHSKRRSPTANAHDIFGCKQHIDTGRTPKDIQAGNAMQMQTLCPECKLQVE